MMWPSDPASGKSLCRHVTPTDMSNVSPRSQSLAPDQVYQRDEAVYPDQTS